MLPRRRQTTQPEAAAELNYTITGGHVLHNRSSAIPQHFSFVVPVVVLVIVLVFSYSTSFTGTLCWPCCPRPLGRDASAGSRQMSTRIRREKEFLA